jgi:agmatinase
MTLHSTPGDDANLYANVFSYLRLPLSRDIGSEPADVVVTGVPFDLAVTARPGARFGPAAIRQASVNVSWEEKRWPWDFAWREHLRVVDLGDLNYAPAGVDDMVARLQAHAAAMLRADRKMLTFGGDHYITLPLLREHAKRHGRIALVHFDSHTDTDDDGTHNHGTMFHHALQEGLLAPEHSVQVGIRTFYDRATHPYAVLDAGWCNDHGAAAVAGEIRRIVGTLPAYLSVDIDVLDPAYAPGTGAPVVGGLSTDLLFKILRSLAEVDFVGMDIVEVAPAYDSGQITALAAAALGLEFLCLLASRKLHGGRSTERALR